MGRLSQAVLADTQFYVHCGMQCSRQKRLATVDSHRPTNHLRFKETLPYSVSRFTAKRRRGERK